MYGHFDWAEKWSKYLPNKIALSEVGSEYCLTFNQLNNLGNYIATYFTEDLKLTKGDRIVIVAETCLSYLILFSAAQKTGVILVPLNFRLMTRELDYLLNNAKPKALFYQNKYAKTLNACSGSESIPFKVNLDIFQPDVFDKKDIVFSGVADPQINADDIAFILYTSGTTGFPKGAIYTYKMMFWNSENTALRLGITDEDRTLNVMPFFHTGGWNVLQTPFLHRGAYVAHLKKFDPNLALDLLETEKITIFMAVPTMLKMMADADNFEKADLSSLRFFIVGGEAMPLPLIEKWHQKGVAIRQGYGLTEFGPNVTSLHQDDAIQKMGSIGKPNFYIDYKIVNDQDKPVQQGEIGELCLKGPTCTPGYWNKPDETYKAIKNDWFYTGDYVREDEDQFLYVVDRKKSMYISGGENVYPAEVEKYLLTHPAISEAVVIGVPDAKWGETGKAFIVLDKNVKLQEIDILNYCKGNLAKFKIPKTVIFLETLPKNDTGKIDRNHLRNNS